jgi:hypothetical protein
MAMKWTLGLAAAQPEVAMQTQKMAIRILMAATHHPATATTPQGKAIHHDWRKSAHESPRTPYGLPEPPSWIAETTP